MNSDDAYASDRLARMVAALDDEHALAFSGVALVDDRGRAGERCLRAGARRARGGGERGCRTCCTRWCGTTPPCRPATWCSRAAWFATSAVSRRCASATTGTSCSPRPTQRASRSSMHRCTCTGFTARTRSPALTLAGRLESDLVLDRFFARLPAHPWLDAEGRDALRAFARSVRSRRLPVSRRKRPRRCRATRRVRAAAVAGTRIATVRSRGRHPSTRSAKSASGCGKATWTARQVRARKPCATRPSDPLVLELAAECEIGIRTAEGGRRAAVAGGALAGRRRCSRR